MYRPTYVRSRRVADSVNAHHERRVSLVKRVNMERNLVKLLNSLEKSYQCELGEQCEQH